MRACVRCQPQALSFAFDAPWLVDHLGSESMGETTNKRTRSLPFSLSFSPLSSSLLRSFVHGLGLLIGTAIDSDRRRKSRRRIILAIQAVGIHSQGKPCKSPYNAVLAEVGFTLHTRTSLLCTPAHTVHAIPLDAFIRPEQPLKIGSALRLHRRMIDHCLSVRHPPIALRLRNEGYTAMAKQPC